MSKNLMLITLVSLANACGGAPQPTASPTTPTASQLDKNKALVRRFYDEVWNKGHLDVAEEVFTKEYTRHDPGGGGGPAGGPEGQKEIAAGIRVAFPDLVMTVDFVVGEGEMVAARWTITGTHRADLPIAKATGKQVRFSGINVFRFDHGKVVELWNHRDDLAMLMQLGALKLPSP